MDKLSTSLQLKIADRPTQTILRNQSSYVQNQFETMPKSHFKKIPGVTIPDNFDGRKVWEGLMSPVMNQGSCGSCWAFASCSTLSDRFNIQSVGFMNIHLSPAKLILCDFHGQEFSALHPEADPEVLAEINVKNLLDNSCHGNTLYDAWRYLYAIGSNTEECQPYNQSIGTEGAQYNKLGKYQDPVRMPLCGVVSGRIGDMCSDVYYDKATGEEHGTAARFYRCFHFYSIAGTPKDGGSDLDIRANIYRWGPVSTGIQVYPDFYTFDAKNDIYKWNGIGPRVGGHAVSIVGWGEENETKYWIIRNSWGKEWGMDGFFRMIRGENNCKVEENVITGVPDFFYPVGFILTPDEHFWLENEDAIEEREAITTKIRITGGGIDPTSGYTRRIINTKPWIDTIRPISKDALPDGTKFIAARDASPANRYQYQRAIRQGNKDIKYGKQSMYLTMTILTILIILTLIVIWMNR